MGFREKRVGHKGGMHAYITFDPAGLVPFV